MRGEREEELIELGRKNAELLENASAWCAHLRAEETSRGLLAEMTGLPIASHRISCKHATGGSESMNLPWILPDFVVANCDTCPHHHPTGSTSWGAQVLSQHKIVLAREAKAEAAEEERLAELRIRIKAHISKAGPEQSIFELCEALISADPSVEPARELTEAARIAPELFSDQVLETLSDCTLSDRAFLATLPAWAKLAPKRALELPQRFRAVAYRALGLRRVELGGRILACLTGEPSSHETTRRLIFAMNFSFPRHSDYPFSTALGLLLASWEGNPGWLTDVVRELLGAEDRHSRLHAASLLAELIPLRPEIGSELLDDLFRVLERSSGDLGDNAARSCASCLAKLFLLQPEAVDKPTLEFVKSAAPGAAGAAVQIYTQLFRQLDSKSPKSSREAGNGSVLTHAGTTALERCVQIAADADLSIEARLEAVKALDGLAIRFPREVFERFELLLGVYALLEEDPPGRVRILVPGTAQSPLDARMEQFSQQTQWRLFKAHLSKLLKNVTRALPEEAADLVVDCASNLSADMSVSFRVLAHALLGELGMSHDLRPRVAPLLMKGLMDFESSAVRAVAIGATREVFRASGDLPDNFLEVIVLHLKDTYVVVHEAAIAALARSDWFSIDRRELANAARYDLCGWALTYRGEPFKLEKIADALLSVTSNHPSSRESVVRFLCELLPTGEELVDQAIVEELLDAVPPDSDQAELLASVLLECARTGDRDRYNSYSFQSRCKMFRWLHGLSEKSIRNLGEEILVAGKELGTRDGWEACHLASLCSLAGLFQAESEILSASAKAMCGEKSLEAFREELLGLSAGARLNAEKVVALGSAAKAIKS